MPERESEALRLSAAKHGTGGYFLVQRENGVMLCSCGRGLVKLDEETWKCPGGYPVYRPGNGDIIKDKFGNILFRMTEH